MALLEPVTHRRTVNPHGELGMFPPDVAGGPAQLRTAQQGDARRGQCRRRSPPDSQRPAQGHRQAGCADPDAQPPKPGEGVGASEADTQDDVREPEPWPPLAETEDQEVLVFELVALQLLKARILELQPHLLGRQLVPGRRPHR